MRLQNGALALGVSLCSVYALAVDADPLQGTTITWRILANHGEPAAAISSRFELVVVDRHGTRRVGPFELPCYLSTDDDALTCTYGGAFDILRVRRVGGRCVAERQLSTEHGNQPPHQLAAFRCEGPIHVSVGHE